ncbi:MAG: BON domain-containing protein [Actinomycetota bacterium]|nr:BON domain-containing protein [Actinomycetota bacterium]
MATTTKTSKRRLATAAALGAAATYFFDPDRGRTRRIRAKDQTLATFRRIGRRTERLRRATEAETYGLWQKATHRTPADPEPDDATLAHKVESEIFGDPNIPKGKINVNAEDGVVVLRGELDHPEDINSLEARVQKIPGVVDVRNLLHLPGTPAQNKEAARQSSATARGA